MLVALVKATTSQSSGRNLPRGRGSWLSSATRIRVQPRRKALTECRRVARRCRCGAPGRLCAIWTSAPPANGLALRLRSLLELLHRGRHSTPGETLQAMFNLTGEPQPFAPPAAETWLLSSEAGRYQGGRHEALPLDHLLPYECVAFGPAS
jgi:hypothetical protein